MLNEEHELRKAANNLILVLTINEQIKQGLESFQALLSMSDFEKRTFYNPSSMSAYTAAKEGLQTSFEQFKATYGSAVISAAYEAFKKALSKKEFCIEVGIKSELTKSEAATVFNKVFQELSEQKGAFPEEADGYAIFIEMIRQAMNPTEALTESIDVCPYCDGMPTRISKAEFFGDAVDDVDGYVWACECGAYAQVAPDGSVVGLMADRTLHSKRKTIRHIVFELSRMIGVTVFEGCKWLSYITGRKIISLQDVEWLNETECEKVFGAFEDVKERLKFISVEYPKSHKELFAFLEDGGRFSAINSYGYKSGRLFVPIKVGNEAVRVRFRKGIQDIMLPKEIDYQFNGQQFVLLHPTGKRERFKLYAKEQRQVLYKEEKQNV